jgi:SAM-dependent methyltransferase
VNGVPSQPVSTDTATEEVIRNRLLSHYAPSYGDRASGYVASMLRSTHVEERYEYLRSVIGEAGAFLPGPILIFGFGAGTELLVARQFGFSAVIGVEVDPFLVDVARQRLRHVAGIRVSLYDGVSVPLPDQSVAVLISGHIIEHTGDPAAYLRECFRLLMPGGTLFLEFPTRFHWRELHTGLPSLEWLPLSLRNAGLRLLSHRVCPLPGSVKARYESILTTGLQQVSVRSVRAHLRRMGLVHTVKHQGVLWRGVVRCVLQAPTRPTPACTGLAPLAGDTER